MSVTFNKGHNNNMDTQIKVTRDTVFKTRPVQASTLDGTQKVGVAAGQVYKVKSWQWHKDKSHYIVTLAHPLQGRYIWYVFASHADIIGGEQGVLLDVPFFPQTDNSFQPDRTCNSSSHAMLVSYLLPSAIKGDDQYIDRFIRGKCDTTNHDCHTAALSSLGIKSEWRYNLDFNDIDEQLRRGIPMPIGILHRGEDWAPTGTGHIVTVIGVSPDGTKYTVHDSYGSIKDRYRGSVHNGKAVQYERSILHKRWLLGTPGNGWGRVVL